MVVNKQDDSFQMIRKLLTSTLFLLVLVALVLMSITLIPQTTNLTGVKQPQHADSVISIDISPAFLGPFWCNVQIQSDGVVWGINSHDGQDIPRSDPKKVIGHIEQAELAHLLQRFEMLDFEAMRNQLQPFPFDVSLHSLWISTASQKVNIAFLPGDPAIPLWTRKFVYNICVLEPTNQQISFSELIEDDIFQEWFQR